MTTTPTPEQVLALPLDPGDVTGAYSTVRGYLEHERLNPPGGDWKWPLYVALSLAGLLPGVTVDPGNADGDVLVNFPEAAQAEADTLITAAAEALGGAR
jgi:hypothetical protein